MYQTYRGKAAVFLVYIAEAHSAGGWQEQSNLDEGVVINQHTTFEERAAAARLLDEEMKLGIPTLVDGLDNAAAEAFAAWPERIYVIGRDGRIAFKGGPGPYGFSPEEAAEALDCLVNYGSGFE